MSMEGPGRSIKVGETEVGESEDGTYEVTLTQDTIWHHLGAGRGRV
jgi:hypothetical protein